MTLGKEPHSGIRSRCPDLLALTPLPSLCGASFLASSFAPVFAPDYDCPGYPVGRSARSKNRHPDIFCYFSEFLKAPLGEPERGQRYSYRLEDTPQGVKAVDTAALD